MFILPAPHELEAIAARIAQHATNARTRSASLAATVATLDWQGLAAAAFHEQAGLVIAGLRSAAGQLDEAADALRRHAARVETAEAGLHRVEGALAQPARLLGPTGRVVGRLAGALGW